MKDSSHRAANPRSPLPVSFIAALALIAAFAVMLIWDQSTWWASKDEYMFGYLVPLFVAYIVFDRWGAIRGLLGGAAANRMTDDRRQKTEDGETTQKSERDNVQPSDGSTEPLSSVLRPLSSEATVPRWLQIGTRGLAGAGLVAGLMMFSLGAFYRAGTGASQPGSLAMAMGFAAIALTVLYLAIPGRRTADGGPGSGAATVRPAGSLTDAPSDRTAAVPQSSALRQPSSVVRPLSSLMAEPRWQVTCLFAFPALVWMVSAPLVSAVENSLSTFLLGKVTVIVFFTFDALGYPLERQGSVLVLPLGQVGVAEACSGIRSLTGSIFSGCFLAAAFLRGLPRKVGLVFAAVVLAFGMNIVRSLILTAVAYAQGPEAIEGTVHDVTGFAVLGGTFLGLLALLPLFGRDSGGAAAR